MRTTFYIQFQADRSGPRGNVRAITAKRMTQRMPWEPLSDSAVIRFDVDLPDAAFAIPTVKVSIPVSDAGLPLIEAEGVGYMAPEAEEVTA
jgi:hypothetical protein